MSLPRHYASLLVLTLAPVLGPVLGVGAAQTAQAQEEARAQGERRVRRNIIEIDARTRAAVRRGLDFLAKRQKTTGKGKGAFRDGVGRKVNNTYLAREGDHVGVTALAGMAFLSAGSTPKRGPYGDNVDMCVDFVCNSVNQMGFVTNDGSRMYSHAFATLFLAEVYGMAPSKRVRDSLYAACRLIVKSQNEQGGWRYLPGAKDSDISITVCQVQALRAANNVGIKVDKGVIDKATEYVKRSYIGKRRGGIGVTRAGGFWYQVYENLPFRPSRTSFALTGAGVTALYGAGIYNSEEIRGGLDFLFNSRPPARNMHNTFDYFYGHYYAMQAFFQRGEPYWSQWYPVIRDEILNGQYADGRWEDLVGPNYATSMACIILQIPSRYLPIFER